MSGGVVGPSSLGFVQSLSVFSIYPDVGQELQVGLCIASDLLWSSRVISFPCPKELVGHQVWGLAMGGQEVGHGWASSGPWVVCKWALAGLQVGHGKAVSGHWLGCKRAMGGL